MSGCASQRSSPRRKRSKPRCRRRGIRNWRADGGFGGRVACTVPQKFDTSGKSPAYLHHRSKSKPAPGNRTRAFSIELLSKLDGSRVGAPISPRGALSQRTGGLQQLTSFLFCDDGQRLVFVDDDAGSVSEVDVPSGAVTRTLATYEKQLFHPKISFSPDLKNVASDRPLNLVSSTVNLKAIQLKGRLHIRWSPDSSQFLVISGRTGTTRPDIVEIFNAQYQKIGSGTVPAQFLFRDGWFANSHALFLYLGSIDDEFGSGVILRCNIENWKCDQIARNVLGASVGGDGGLGIVP